jgi:cell wall-associated NlpC family hydrolase
MKKRRTTDKIYWIALTLVMLTAMVGVIGSVSPAFNDNLPSQLHATNPDLGTQAAGLAKEVVGAPYIWGGKGFDWKIGIFEDSATIKSGYYYYSGTLGKGLDCSGLSFWAFNKAAGATEYQNSTNPIYAEGAQGQWNDNKRFQQISKTIPSISDLKPGYLLFLYIPDLKVPYHVGMYVGDGNVIHAKGPEGTGTIEKKTLDEWLNLPVNGKTYRDYFLGYGKVISSLPDQKFKPGDTVRVTSNLHVYTSYGITNNPEITDPDYQNSAPTGTIGIIISGPQKADGYVWWNVNYGPYKYSGWSAENWLEKVDATTPSTVHAFGVTPYSSPLLTKFTIP